MGKQKNPNQTLMTVVLVFAIVLMAGVLGHFTGINKMIVEKGLGMTYMTAVGEQPASGGIQQTGLDGTISCPDTLVTAMTFTAQNKLNTTGTESYDNTYYIYDKATGSLQETGTDTTAGTENLQCGKTYVMKLVSADGSAGDNSKILSATSNAKVVDGNIEFTTSGSSMQITLYTSQHAVLEARMYDNVNKALMYNDADASALDYETDGATFMSTTNNATVYDETVGVDIELEARATITDGDFNDNGVYVLLDAMDTSIWQEPSVYVDGSQLSDVKGSLSVYESRAYSGYDYVYKFDKRVQDSGDGIKVRLVATLIDGATATSDIQVDLASIGAYKSIQNDNVIVGSVTDTATTTTVFAVQDFNLDITA